MVGRKGEGPRGSWPPRTGPGFSKGSHTEGVCMCPTLGLGTGPLLSHQRNPASPAVPFGTHFCAKFYIHVYS